MEVGSRRVSIKSAMMDVERATEESGAGEGRRRGHRDPAESKGGGGSEGSLTGLLRAGARLHPVCTLDKSSHHSDRGHIFCETGTAVSLVLRTPRDH